MTTGFGSYRRAGAPSFQAAATLDVLQGRTGPAPIVATKFPGDLSILPLAQLSYRGGESPDPLTPCPGYNPGMGQPISTGLPLFALLPNAPAAGTVTATLTRQGSLVESCVYDETSYTNPNPDDQTLGRQVLAGRHQVVVVPRAPLVSGSTYAVSVASMDAGTMAPDGASWSFSDEARGLDRQRVDRRGAVEVACRTADGLAVRPLGQPGDGRLRHRCRGPPRPDRTTSRRPGP